ncbi:ESCRT-II complex, vps25 subunit [Xylariaceae sp. FL0594]|nr:ESCRT-II complex, vps25 subunit [Xylariaceae sp. FL0594]
MASQSPSLTNSIGGTGTGTGTGTPISPITSPSPLPLPSSTSLSNNNNNPPSQPTLPSSQTKKEFQFPREHHFPPFFTRQPNQSTRRSQLIKWTTLILSYCSFHRITKLSLSSPAAEALFANKRIDRRLSLADVREIIDFMRRDGRAEYITGGSKRGGNSSSSSSGGGEQAGDDWYYGDTSGSVGAGSGDVVWIFWKTPEEWAALVEAWVDETAQKGAVLTLYELCEGEDTRGTEFHGLDPELLQRALQVLVKRGKAQIFGQDDRLGVKFF